MLQLAGKRFGRLVALYPNGRDHKGHVIWHCRCDCGNECDVPSRYLTGRNTTSCGCYGREQQRKAVTIHGDSYTRLYRVYSGMLKRCRTPNTHEYENYGGRGVTVCEEWQSYEGFRDWAMANGYDPDAKHGKCTLDRIDTNKGYSPDNCRWVSMKTQERNKRNNVNITYKGETHCITEWAEIVGLKSHTIRDRLKRGWCVEDALFRPLVYRG